MRFHPCLAAFVAFLPASIAIAAPDPVAHSTNAPAYGTSDQILYSLGRTEFSPIYSSTTYDEAIGRFSNTGSGVFVAALHLPSGVLLTYLELDYLDVSGPDDVDLELRICDYFLSSCNTYPISSGTGSSGINFVFSDLTPLGITTDNFAKKYELRAITESGTSSTQLLGAYVGYKLQVSPAPASATFADVPTTHPYFRFVEALVDAGITSGCGGGNYCVSSPITRGEMAVFLAAALGLHFPN
jgi:hypothetical protein